MKKLVLKILLVFAVVMMSPTPAFGMESETQNQSGDYVDPFDYWDGSEIDGLRRYDGSYLKDSTHSYGIHSSEDIINFNYEKSTHENRVSLLSNTDGFSASYYENQWQAVNGSIDKVYSKKTVRPTENPNRFEVEVDIISGTTQTKQIPKVDVVFVLDKSSSMNYGLDKDSAPSAGQATRWQVLVEALNEFVSSNLGDTDKDIQMAFVSYGSNETDWRNYQQYADVFDFGSKSNVFTKDANKIKGHAALSAPGSDSWTPTYLGVEIGAMLLESGPTGTTVNSFGSRNDAKKVLITLTDGVPSYVHVKGSNASSTSYTNRRLGGSSTIGGNYRSDKSAYRYTDETNVTWGTSEQRSISDSSGVRNAITDTKTSIKVAFDRLDLITPTNLKSSVDRYAIGFAFGVNKNATIRQDVKNFLEFLGKDGMFSADAPGELQKNLEAISQHIKSETPLLKESGLIDPMSAYVTLDKSSIKTSSLKLKHEGNGKYLLEEPSPYTGNARSFISDDSIQYSNLTLGGSGENRDGFRITYRVTLKPEFQNGLFYPVNGPTYLEAPNYDNFVSFTVPSVRYRHVEYGTFGYKKIWDDEENMWNTREPITLQLQELRNELWEDVEGQSVTINLDDPLEGVFEDIPITTFDYTHQYRVIETSVHKNYQKPNQEMNIVTNTLKTRELILTKQGEDETVKLSGVEFILYRSDEFDENEAHLYPSLSLTSGLDGTLYVSGRETVARIPIGKYMLREIVPLLGYQNHDDIYFEVKEDLSIVGFEPGNVIKNELKDFALTVHKVDENNNPLIGAQFNLKSATYDKTQESMNNVFTFEGLKPGTYELRELASPSGYIRIKKPLVIEIQSDGSIRVDEKTVEDSEFISDESGITTDGNKIELTLINHKKGILPMTGGIGSLSTQQLSLVLIGLSLSMGAIFVIKVKLGGKQNEKAS